MIFADASAVIAIIAGERNAGDLADKLAAVPDRLCSAMSLWETVAGLRRSHGLVLSDARLRTERFRVAMDLRITSIGETEMYLALDAYAQYGKGRHKAALNMGDCFAYACARAHGARLLYTGDDFAQTDLAWDD